MTVTHWFWLASAKADEVQRELDATAGRPTKKQKADLRATHAAKMEAANG